MADARDILFECEPGYYLQGITEQMIITFTHFVLYCIGVVN
jgi:hypothetical protein